MEKARPEVNPKWTSVTHHNIATPAIKAPLLWCWELPNLLVTIVASKGIIRGTASSTSTTWELAEDVELADQAMEADLAELADMEGLADHVGQAEELAATMEGVGRLAATMEGVGRQAVGSIWAV